MPRKTADISPVLESETPYFFISKAVIISKIDKEGKIQEGNTPSDRDRNQRMIVSAKINPPIIRNNSAIML